MAQERLRRRENTAGDLYVDSTCIDCDTCRWMAPQTFARVAGQSAVTSQPGGPANLRRALQALVSCPTASIGYLGPASRVAEAAADFPVRVAGPVHHCGYHAESSFGAASYFALHPEGNFLVDSPRFSEPLARRIEALGGARRMLLSHRDDVADAARWQERLGLELVLHEADARPLPGLRLLEGDRPIPLASGVLAIPTPGHTAGSTCYLFAPVAQAAGVHGAEGGGPFLFTGDHLAFGADGLEAWPEVCWYDWGRQTDSMRNLLQHDFAWVLPGHGAPGRLDVPQMRRHLRRLVEWMGRQEGR